MHRMLFSVGLTALVAAVTVTVAVAAKPGPGTSTGTAAVFVSNPVEDLGNQSLLDQKDSATAVPAAAYHTVLLTDLDGSGFLRGRWAEIVGETGNRAYSPINSFVYNRSQDEFEQVMAYYWITESQRYIQSLGFGSTRRPVNMEPQRLRINQFGLDNSFATTHKDEIRLGKGGVDDAEDGEVVNHEYGHAIHFSQNFAFASVEAGAISEGFGDYWAVTVTQVVRQQLGLPPTLRSGVRRRLGLDVLRSDCAALPASGRFQPPLPGEPRGSGSRGWTNLVAGALGHPERIGQRPCRHRHPRRAVQLRRNDDDPARRAHGRCSERHLRIHGGKHRPRAVRRAGDSFLAGLRRGRLRAPPLYQPRVSSSSSGLSDAVESPDIASPSPRDACARIFASL